MTAASFDHRLASLARRHRRMEAAGVTYRLGRDGLITARPRRRGLGGSPLRTVALLLLGGLACKVLLLAALGGPTYADRVGALASGSTLERAGAWVMQADPATRAAAEALVRLAG